MKVFNLQCAHGHPFEGWFKDLAAYEDQREGGLLECPYCGSREVEKTLSAPRLNLSAAAINVVREALSSSEDVGARFAEEARAIHAGEAPPRSIYGQTSLETACELAEEGIPVLPLPFANLLKSPLQ
jgi:hypothetical protein